VAKLSVLICDLCTGKNRYAVVTRQLVVKGTSVGPEIDLCRSHEQKFLILFKAPRREPKAKLAKGKTRVAKINYEKDIFPKIMAYADRGQKFTAMKVGRMLKISSQTVAYRACAMLVKAGKLKRFGKGAGSWLEIVPPKNNGKAAA
jgi:predicted HTH transcriptional regulator